MPVDAVASDRPLCAERRYEAGGLRHQHDSSESAARSPLRQKGIVGVPALPSGIVTLYLAFRPRCHRVDPNQVWHVHRWCSLFRRLYNPYVLCAAVLVTSRNQTQRFLHWANDREQRKNGRFVPKYWSSRLARSHCCMLNIQDPESALTEITRRERTHINRLSVLSDPKKDFSNLLKTFDDLIKQTTKQQDAQGKDKAAAQSGVRLLLRTLVDPAEKECFGSRVGKRPHSHVAGASSSTHPSKMAKVQTEQKGRGKELSSKCGYS